MRRNSGKYNLAAVVLEGYFKIHGSGIAFSEVYIRCQTLNIFVTERKPEDDLRFFYVLVFINLLQIFKYFKIFAENYLLRIETSHFI